MFLFILMLIIVFVFVLLGFVRDIINFSNFNFSFNSPKPGQRRVYAASLLYKRQKLWRTGGRPAGRPTISAIEIQTGARIGFIFAIPVVFNPEKVIAHFLAKFCENCNCFQFFKHVFV